MDVSDGTHSQLSKWEQRWSEMVHIHSRMNGDNGGQRWYTFTAEKLSGEYLRATSEEKQNLYKIPLFHQKGVCLI